MPAPVKTYESADPADLGLLRAQTLVLEARALAHYRDEGWFRRRRRITGTIRRITHDAYLRNNELEEGAGFMRRWRLIMRRF